VTLVRDDEVANPIDIGFFGAVIVMACANESSWMGELLWYE